jgi:hypothetical protein
MLGRGDGTFKLPVLSGQAGPFQVATLLGQFTGDAGVDAVSVVRTGSDDDAASVLVLDRGNGDGKPDVVELVPGSPFSAFLVYVNITRRG